MPFTPASQSSPRGPACDDQNYFFRVRTIVDENGRIVSALYGKIDRDIEFWANERLRFTYYLNPAPNDRNMEFYPSRNLFQNLRGFETPTAP